MRDIMGMMGKVKEMQAKMEKMQAEIAALVKRGAVKKNGYYMLPQEANDANAIVVRRMTADAFAGVRAVQRALRQHPAAFDRRHELAGRWSANYTVGRRRCPGVASSSAIVPESHVDLCPASISSARAITAPGATFGTIGYFSPEQARAERALPAAAAVVPGAERPGRLHDRVAPTVPRTPSRRRRSRRG